MPFKYSIMGEKESSHISFFLENNLFEYIDIKNIFDVNEPLLFVVSHNKTADELIKTKDLFCSLSDTAVFLIPSHLKKFNFFKNKKVIYYPIDISRFYKLIENYLFVKNLFFKDLVLEKNNYLKSKENNKKIYLTETESRILKAMFFENKIKKEALKENILNLKSTVDTKSLESHLSRIRKKINSLDSKVSIVSLDMKYLFIS